MKQKYVKMDLTSNSYVQKEVWSLVDYFKYEQFESKDYAVLLFILVLNNERMFDRIKVAKKEEIKEKIWLSITTMEDESKSKILKELFDFYSEALFSLSQDALQSLLNDLKDLEALPSLESDQSYLRGNFIEIFDFVLYKMAKLEGKSAGEHFLPVELARFVSELSDVSTVSMVYNPFAGDASFGVFFENNPLYFFQEKNENIRAIGMLRLLAYGKQDRSINISGDSIKDWFELEEGAQSDKLKYDLVISNPPFGKLPTDINGQFGTIRTYEHFLIEKGIESIKANGKIIAILTTGFLFRGGSEQKLRESLIQQDLIETIITLPAGLLLQTSIPVVILVLNRNKNDKEKVRFVDASSALKNSNGKEKILDEKIIKEILSEEDSQFSSIVPNASIIENDFNLSVSRYLIREITIDEDESIVKLGDVITSIHRKRSVVGEYGTLVRIRDLKDDAIDFQLGSDIPDDVEIPINSHKIEESCLLLGIRWNKIKPTWFNYSGSPIFISNDIYAIKVDSTKIDTAFLVNELCSDYVTDQLNSYRTGVTVPSLRKEDLLRIKIKVPEYHFQEKFSESLKEQKAKVKGLREEMIRNKERSLAQEKEMLEIQDDAFRNLAAMKHTFRQYLNALKTNVSGTRKFILKNTGHAITMDSIYSQNLNRTLGNHLLSLEGTIDSMSNLLTTLDENKTVAEKIESNLADLIRKGQDMFKNPEIFKFEKLYLDDQAFVQGPDYIAPTVWMHPDDFFRIFSNIVSNAVEHGFKNRTDNIISTSLTFDAENLFCILEISNNGKPMNEDFTLKRLTTRGEKTIDSSGSGVGGADIKSIIDKCNGSFKIDNNNSDEFPVNYVIGFPLVVHS